MLLSVVVSARLFVQMRRVSGISKTATSRRMNLEQVARLHLGQADMPQRFNLSAGSHHQIVAYLARLAAGPPRR